MKKTKKQLPVNWPKGVRLPTKKQTEKAVMAIQERLDKAIGELDRERTKGFADDKIIFA
jgi:hypothetical protein